VKFHRILLFIKKSSVLIFVPNWTVLYARRKELGCVAWKGIVE
jgi:hypothetical protein